MTSSTYIAGRKKNLRPQGMLWSENSGSFDSGVYVPSGHEVGALTSETDLNLIDQFLILSDDNRSPLSFDTTRIERKERMINGRMRSYHIADKLTLDTSWTNLPSRSYHLNPDFDEATGVSPYAGFSNQEFTSDGGAGGGEILDWYESHQGPFWVYLSYDKYKNFEGTDQDRQNLGIYNQVIQMYFSTFNYSVSKRGGSNFDFWEISVSLEEV